jgi:hypothetical protein
MITKKKLVGTDDKLQRGSIKSLFHVRSWGGGGGENGASAPGSKMQGSEKWAKKLIF